MRHVVAEMKAATHWINVCTGGLGFPLIGPTDEIGYINLALLEPQVLSKWTELQAKHLMAALPWYAEEGVDSVMPCADLGSSTGLFGRPILLEQHVKHWWEEHNRRAHELGLTVIKHCCGNIWEALPMLCDAGFDGYEGIQASGTMDMKVLKQRYGDRLTSGAESGTSTSSSAPQTTSTPTRYAIQHGAPGGGSSTAQRTPRHGHQAREPGNHEGGPRTLRLLPDPATERRGLDQGSQAHWQGFAGSIAQPSEGTRSKAFGIGRSAPSDGVTSRPSKNIVEEPPESRTMASTAPSRASSAATSARVIPTL